MLNNALTTPKSYVHFICAAPAEHLLQQLQHLDAENKGFHLVGSSQCPFKECLDAYMQMLQQPLQHRGIVGLISYATPQGLQEIHNLCQAAFCFALVMGSRVWRELLVPATQFPSCLSDLGSDLPEVRQACANELFGKSKCCLDEDASLKVRAWRPCKDSLL